MLNNQTDSELILSIDSQMENNNQQLKVNKQTDPIIEWEDQKSQSILKTNHLPITLDNSSQDRKRFYSNNEFRKVSFDESLNTVHTYTKDNRKEIKNFETSFKQKKKVDKPELPKSKRFGNHKKRKNSF
ncbi:unnamed protein product (macronuclear) [Paramecium tetraurelia]|uniref:Uncharacterized protein n=1 Tax=Paramecium tetraurelia TaxID=5888 RepID=A0DEP7_PARTE|nr:uncharacterized protein GSPATT00016340001 [Paramecium tetraurelia]CAK81514.1 unnamed protein product [Paramecium tetraurelia]|eukprot:XP_001448911.1 hypothetical protein (macronuclear) [Paramecium tetraurelia strain d4-2]